MYLCYIDESGNTGNNLNDVHQPLLVLAALVVQPQYIKDIENCIRELSYVYCGAESRNTDFELHGDHIYNGRGRYFKKLSHSKRIDLLKDILRIFTDTPHIHLGYASLRKAEYFGKFHIQQTAFSLIVEGLEQQLSGSLSGYGLLICDEQDELKQKLIDDLDRFKQLFNCIIDSVHFVESKNNYLMQLTDVICYVIRRYLEALYNLRLIYNREKPLLISGNVIEFDNWVAVHGEKRHKLFYQLGKGLLTEDRVLFSKKFP